DVSFSLEVCDKLANQFEGSTEEVIEPILKTLSARVFLPETCQELATFLLRRSTEAIERYELDTAARLGKIAETSAMKSRNLKLAKQVQGLAKEIERGREML